MDDIRNSGGGAKSATGVSARRAVIAGVAAVLAAVVVLWLLHSWQRERMERERRAVETMLNEADALADDAAAEAAYDLIIGRYGTSADPRVRGAVVKARLGKISYTRDETEQARQLDQVIAWLENNPRDRDDDFNLCLSLLSRAELSGDSGERMGLVDRLLARFGESGDPALQGQIARAMWIKAEETGDRMEKVRLLDRVIDRFSSSRDEEVAWEVAKALNMKADTASSPPERVRLYGQVISRYGNLESVFMQGQTVYAMMRLADLSGDGEKRAIYEEVAAKYQGSPDEFIQDSVRRAAEAVERLSGARPEPAVGGGE